MPADLKTIRRRADQALTALMFAVAWTYTAGRLCRRGFEVIRPHLAAALQVLALALDGSLAYPDQPEPTSWEVQLENQVDDLLCRIEHEVAPQAAQVEVPSYETFKEEMSSWKVVALRQELRKVCGCSVLDGHKISCMRKQMLIDYLHLFAVMPHLCP